jgi:hypothetical protein
LIDPRVVRLRASFNRVKVTKYAIPEKVEIADGLPLGSDRQDIANGIAEVLFGGRTDGNLTSHPYQSCFRAYGERGIVNFAAER